MRSSFDTILILTVLFVLTSYYSRAVQLSLPLTARWTQNSETVAGSNINGMPFTELSFVNGISISSDEILFVATTEKDLVFIFEPNSTTAIDVIESNAVFDRPVADYPLDIFLTESDIYILYRHPMRVEKWSENRTNSTLVPGTTTIGDSDYIFVDKFGNLYVSDHDTHRIWRFCPNSRKGESVAGSIKMGSGSKQLNGPRGIFVDDKQMLYISDSENNRIQQWKEGASTGRTVAGRRSINDKLSSLRSPGAIVVDVNGVMYISEINGDRILRWKPKATVGECIVACTGSMGNRADQLSGPKYMAFDRHGSLYVSDFMNNRVQKFKILDEHSEQTLSASTDSNSVEVSSTQLTTTTSSTSISSSQHALTFLVHCLEISFIVLYCE